MRAADMFSRHWAQLLSCNIIYNLQSLLFPLAPFSPSKINLAFVPSPVSVLLAEQHWHWQTFWSLILQLKPLHPHSQKVNLEVLCMHVLPCSLLMTSFFLLNILFMFLFTERLNDVECFLKSLPWWFLFHLSTLT